MIVVLAGEVFLEPPAKIRIGNCPTREYLGLIFAYFGDGEAPPFPRYPHMEEDGILEILSTEIWPGNFFQRIDNNGDTYHVPFVHRGAYSASSANNRAGTSRKPARAGGRSDSGIILYHRSGRGNCARLSGRTAAEKMVLAPRRRDRIPAGLDKIASQRARIG
ncbi:MAG: hypothetical protein ACXWYD_10050 [Candidatus Binatia bacterium]